MKVIRLIILSALLLIIASTDQSRPTNHQSKTEALAKAGDQKTEHSETALESPALATETSIHTAQKTTGNYQQSTRERWFNPNTLPNWVIAVITFIYVCAAIGQWIAIRRQTEAAEKTLSAMKDQERTAADTLFEIARQASAAERTLGILEKQARAAMDQVEIGRLAASAALQSAKATELALNAERPYVFVESQALNATQGSTITSLVEGFTSDSTKIDIGISFQLRNYGKGVTTIEGLRLQARIVPGWFDVVLSKRSFGRNISAKSIEVHIKKRIIGSGETSRYSCGFSLPTSDWESVLSRTTRLFNWELFVTKTFLDALSMSRSGSLTSHLLRSQFLLPTDPNLRIS